MAKFKRGQRKPARSGRKRGSRNRVTVAAKQAVIEALNAKPGAVAYLTKLRNSRVAADRVAFVGLVGKLLPRQIEIEGIDLNDGKPQVVVYLPDNKRGPINGESKEEYEERIRRERR